MKKIEAYQNIEEAMLSLDNGGRFYNLNARANNKIITHAELAKVAGVFSDKQQMILYLEIALSNLSPGMKGIVLAKLTQEVRETYNKFKPQYLKPSEAEKNAISGSTAIISGIPKLSNIVEELTGFVMVPIMAGKSMSMMMIPIMDKYDVYEMRDDEQGEKFFIAHTKKTEKLPSKPITIGGLIKEFKKDKNEQEPSRKFLEAVYFLV